MIPEDILCKLNENELDDHSKEASLKPLDTFKMDAKSTNLIEHVQRNKPADQVSLHSIVSRPLSFNKLSVPKTEVRGLKIRKR